MIFNWFCKHSWVILTATKCPEPGNNSGQPIECYGHSNKSFFARTFLLLECKKCGNFEVVGGIDELKEKAVEGWDKFEGHSPHRPWIDQIKIKCLYNISSDSRYFLRNSC